MSLPLNIVTGFLGAGKTTLLQRALERGVLGRAALLVNEFGAADIDGALLAGAAAGAPLLRLPNGCVCCRVQEDFIAAVRALGARVATGELALDRIVLETSGLADPAPLLAHLLAARPLREVVGAVRVLTVVDGVQGERALAEHVEARHQLACADLIVLSKADRLDAAAFRHWHDTTLPTYGAQAAVVASSGGRPEDPQWLSRLDAAGWTPAGVRPAERTRPRERPDIHGTAQDPGHAHDRHDHDHDHDHDHAPGHGHAPDAHGPAAHSHGIASFHLRCGPLASREQWQGWASTLLLLHAEQLLRLKGFVAFAGEPQRQVLQGAMDGLRLDPWSGEDQPGVASAAATEVVAIARGMDAWRHRDGLRRALLAIAADAALEP